MLPLSAILLGVSVAAPPPLVLAKAQVRVAARHTLQAAAVLLRGGKVAFVGSEEEALKRAPEARVLALPGAVIVPGLSDAHGHLLGLGRARESLDLRGLSAEACAARVKARAAELPAGSWIEGRGWDQNLWPGGAFPTSAPLDAAAAAHPVFLVRVDGHAAWVNGAALRAAGIDAEKTGLADPAGGRFLRDAEGRPSGVAIDNAVDVVREAIPAPDAATIERRLRTAAESCARVGLTSVGDASSYGPAEVAVLRKMVREGTLPIRVYAALGIKPEDLALLAAGPIAEGRLTVRSVKIYADGALGSRGAALLSGYADEPANTGILVTPPERVKEIVARCFRTGFQPWIHAIGDRGNRIALDAIEAGLDSVKPKDARPRVEHVQVVALEDIPRFAKRGVVASVQPTHATSDMAWAPARLGPERLKGAYAYGSLLRSGAHLAGGSDFPIESEDPRLGLYAAVARQDLEGRPPGGFRPEERLTPAEALALFTEGVAWAEHAEGRRGRIAEGFDGDLTVLDGDPVTVPAARLPKLRVLLTIVGGEVVFDGR